jgi:tetratricopeptide (TPR) repeat protein
LRVFISHTSELRKFPKSGSYVAAVERAISACGHVVVVMADFPAGDLPPAELCVERVRSCDVWVGLLGTRYGSPVRDRPELSYVELEFEAATDAGLERLAFLLDTEADDPGIPPSGLIDHEHGARQAEFRRQVREIGLVAQSFADPGVLGQLVERSLRDLPRRRGGEAVVLVRSAYLEQVRRIAPPDPPGLKDRDGELAELARFCLAPDGASYAWWRAGPWAGKSALLSTFVLRPPPEVAGRVKIVSFFITARLAAQDTREAFTQVLLEQLASLLGQSLPALLPEATREAYLLGLLSQAATACAEQGGRLVLVVDGLDEDRGVTTGPDAHSIASLLPADPPAGMRVIVAGRPNPPVPDDVPDWHPLRDPAIVRPLSASAHARDVQRLGRQELQRLLRGSPAEQDVVGLLAAARGGLSARDLAELANAALWGVEDILRTVTGRTLQVRPSLLNPATHPAVYLLGHEELQVAATDYLGGHIARYRGRLHSWADGWRARRWPAETPEYLLAGYFRLLEALGDLPRMTEFALDMARHDRMLDLTGGDVAALAEARTALEHIAAQNHPDLASALTLACHRDHLADRNAHIPTRLPAVWATLGQLARAEALARSITNPISQASALAQIAQALAQAGQRQLAGAVAVQAETTARSITSGYSQAIVLAQVAEALAQAGQHKGAEAVACSITSPDWQAGALAQVARALAQAGQPQHAGAVAAQAETAARSTIIRGWRAVVLAQVAEALTVAGQLQHAHAVARSITDLDRQAKALAQVAEALAQAGQPQQAGAVAAQAGTAARSITDPASRVQTLARVAEALAQIGQHQYANAAAAQADAIARSFTDGNWQATALARVAEALARIGQHQHANAAITQAEAAARSITDPPSRVQALVRVAGALARAGQQQHAEAVAAQVETIARSITIRGWDAKALAQIAEALAQAGQHQHAEAIARSITDLDWQAKALAQIAEALAQAGQHQRAQVAATQAETAARSIANPGRLASALAQIVEALAAAGQHLQAGAAAAQARAAAHSITDPYRQALALAEIADALTGSGRHRETEVVSSSQATALIEVAMALAEMGQHHHPSVAAARAETAARSITDPYWQARALSEIAEALAKAGEAGAASRVAAAACAVGPWTTAIRPGFLVAPSTYTTLVRALKERQ